MTLTAFAVGSALLFASPFSLAAAPSADDDPVFRVEREINVAWGEFGPSQVRSFGAHQCPDELPYLTKRVYHPPFNETLTDVPTGVEIRSNIPVWAAFGADEKKGVRGGTVWNTNTGSRATVYIYLHCTNWK